MCRCIRIRVGALRRFDVELGFVETHAIAGQQRLPLLQTLAIQEGTVRGAEVLDHETASLYPQPRVATRDVTLFDAEISLLAAADDNVPVYDERLIPALTDQMPALAFRHPQSRTADAVERPIIRCAFARGIITDR